MDDPSSWNSDNLKDVDFTQVTRENIILANSGVVEQASLEQAEDYFKDKFPITGLNDNEIILYEKIHSNVNTETFKNLKGVTFKDEGIIYGDKEISFSRETSLKISQVENKLLIGNFLVEKGKIKVNGVIKFSESSTITELNQYGKKSITFNVGKDTIYSPNLISCGGSSNCIGRNKLGDLKVVSKGDNKINVYLYDDSVDKLYVDQINNEGEVNFKDHDKVIVMFNEGPYTVKGSLYDTTVVMENVHQNNEGVEIRSILNNGKIYVFDDLTGESRKSEITFIQSSSFSSKSSSEGTGSDNMKKNTEGTIPENGPFRVMEINSKKKAIDTKVNAGSDKLNQDLSKTYTQYISISKAEGNFKERESPLNHFDGIGITKEEAVINALNSATNYHNTEIGHNTESTQFSYSKSSRINDVFVSSTEFKQNSASVSKALILDYEVINIAKDEEEKGHYAVDIKVTFGEDN